jgi:outer membrane receptor protein involved in Fe transport
MNLLQGLPGVRIVDSADAHLVVSSRGSRVDLRNGMLADCRLAIGVDGIVRGQQFDVNAVDPKDIHAIEVYRGAASAPRELMSTADGSCGLVMIWTRSK